MPKANDRLCWKQIWAAGRAVVYVRDKSTLEDLAKKNGKWWAPVGKPVRCVAPKGAKIR